MNKQSKESDIIELDTHLELDRINSTEIYPHQCAQLIFDKSATILSFNVKRLPFLSKLLDSYITSQEGTLTQTLHTLIKMVSDTELNSMHRTIKLLEKKSCHEIVLLSNQYLTG